MRVTEVLVRLDNDTELVIDEIGPGVSDFDIGQRVTFALYRVRADEMILGDVLYVDSTNFAEVVEWSNNFDYDEEARRDFERTLP